MKKLNFHSILISTGIAVVVSPMLHIDHAYAKNNNTIEIVTTETPKVDPTIESKSTETNTPKTETKSTEVTTETSTEETTTQTPKTDEIKTVEQPTMEQPSNETTQPTTEEPTTEPTTSEPSTTEPKTPTTDKPTTPNQPNTGQTNEQPTNEAPMGTSETPTNTQQDNELPQEEVITQIKPGKFDPLKGEAYYRDLDKQVGLLVTKKINGDETIAKSLEKEQKTSHKTSKKKKVKHLPNTGETMPFAFLSIGLLMIGCIFMMKKRSA